MNNYKDKLRQPETQASEYFARFTPMEQAEIRRAALHIDKTACNQFTARVWDIADRLRLPSYLGMPDAAPFFAPRLEGLFRNSALGEAGHIRNLDDEQFDALLFASALLRHGFSSAMRPVLLAQAFLKAVVDGLPKVKDPLVTTKGVETEFFGFQPEDIYLLDNAIDFHDDGWLRAEDSTIRPDDGTKGIELISPILDNANIHRLSFHAALLSMLGAKTSHSCALHVHAGINNTFRHRYTDDPSPSVMRFRTEIMKQILVNYVDVEEDLSFLNKPVVRNYHDKKVKNFYLSDLEPFSVHAVLEKACFEDFIAGNSIVQPHGREEGKINFVSMNNYGTIEFRHHPGTVSPAKMVAWVEFLNTLIQQAADIVRANGKARLPDPGEQEYLRDRVADLARLHRQPIAAPCPSA